MSPAVDDERTARHERAKDRAFTGVILIGVSLIVLGFMLMTKGSWWVFLGGFMLLTGLSFGGASVLGLIYRRKARRVLQTHEWITAPVKVLARPASGRNGRTIFELPEQERSIAVTGLAPEVTNRIEREGRLQYAGDLDGTSMIFTRVVDGDEVYIAVLPRKRADDAA